MRHAREEFSLKDAVDFLSKSEIAEYIRRAKVVRGYCDIEYRAIRVGVNRSKHRNVIPSENPRYFEFTRKHLSTIIGLVYDNSTCGIKMTSKSIQLTEAARSKFLQGWDVVREKYGIDENPKRDGSS